jgi:hypothetical protein
MRIIAILVLALAAGAASAQQPRPAPETPLDVTELRERLRDTDAMGLFTKIALRNQMDELMGRFRSHHRGGHRRLLADLRPSYDLLVLKVLALVQDGDPSLARSISGSREAIWTILSDPHKFRALT